MYKHRLRKKVFEQGQWRTKIVHTDAELGSGVIDKNGREIFESDIIKNPNYNPNDYMDTPNFIIVYDEARASFVYRDPVLHKNGCEPFPNDDLADFDGELEVVGHAED